MRLLFPSYANKIKFYIDTNIPYLYHWKLFQSSEIYQGFEFLLILFYFTICKYICLFNNILINLFYLDLWFWIGQSGGIRWIPSYDSGSCYSVLSGSGNPDGQSSLQQCYWHLVCRMYLCRTTRTKNTVSGTKSHSAGMIVL